MPKELITRMVRNNLVDGLEIVSKRDDKCVDCSLGKCRQAAHLPSQRPKASKASQTLHMDPIGPVSPRGICGERFVLVIREEKSCFRLTFNIQAKSEVRDLVKLAIKQAESQTCNSVASLISDNGTEFAADRLTVFTQHKGIEHIFLARF